MTKRAKKLRVRKPTVSRSEQRVLRLAEVLRRNLFQFVLHEGMKALEVMLEEDREALCGPAHRKSGPADAVRWGHTEGRLSRAASE